MARWRDLVRRGLLALGGGPTRSAGKPRIAAERLSPLESRLGETRIIDVYLPEGYASTTDATYPVLYANDGQDMETMGLAGTLDTLQRSGRITPVIVVAVHARERVLDYGTAYVPNAQGLGARAERYGQFLISELMPAIDARYRTRRDAAQTGIMGWSLGGLSAFDLAWRRPDRFGQVGVFSGSFWWRTDDSSVAARQTSRIMHRRVRETPGRPPLRIWLQTGLQDESADRDGNGLIDSIQDTEELIAELEGKGYRRGRDVVHLTVEGAHDLPTWKRLLPEWLTWAFPGSS